MGVVKFKYLSCRKMKQFTFFWSQWRLQNLFACSVSFPHLKSEKSKQKVIQNYKKVISKKHFITFIVNIHHHDLKKVSLHFSASVISGILRSVWRLNTCTNPFPRTRRAVCRSRARRSRGTGTSGCRNTSSARPTCVGCGADRLPAGRGWPWFWIGPKVWVHPVPRSIKWRRLGPIWKAVDSCCDVSMWTFLVFVCYVNSRSLPLQLALFVGAVIRKTLFVHS